MNDIVSNVDRWREEGKDVALATVVRTWGSGPRGVGAKLAMASKDRRDEITGSVSGGCVEGAVVEAGREVLRTGVPQLLSFGVADETAWQVGLSCGGRIEVFVTRLDPTVYREARRAMREDRPVATVGLLRGPRSLLGKEIVVVDGETVLGSVEAGLDPELIHSAREALARGRARRVELGKRNGELTEAFVDVILPPPTLVMVGGVHVAIALTELAKALGYRTVVVDPRSVFGSGKRFAHVDRLMHEWPDEALDSLGIHRSTAVATLTHDPKLDDPALRVALPSPAFYVGALGSRRTNEKRLKRLRDAGLGEEHLRRLHAPIGVDIGARTPEEIALAILAEVVAVGNRSADEPTAASKPTSGE